MNNVLCVQISTHLINGAPDLNDIATTYYATLYNSKNKEGYYKSYHFWECPLWVAEIDHNTPTDFYVCDNIKDCINHIKHSDYKYICFSVLDVNKDIIKQIITGCNKTKHKYLFVLGGYIDFSKFFFDWCLYPKTIKEFIEIVLNLKYKQGTSYRLFKNYTVIPRLTLSTGCTNKCDFCTVEKQIKRTLFTVVEQQIKSFKPLKFKLVYINDKTFGQCSNYKTLSKIYKKIKEYNSSFEGFIIQTTTTQFNKLDNAFLYDSHIKYVELGIETFNNDILKKYHKPSNEKTTVEACIKIRDLNNSLIHIKLIPNIIIGMPEETIETYLNTMNFIKDNKDIISHLNIYSLAVYDNTPLSQRITVKEHDSDENSLNKSFLRGAHHKQFYDAIHKISIKLLIEG